MNDLFGIIIFIIEKIFFIIRPVLPVVVILVVLRFLYYFIKIWLIRRLEYAQDFSVSGTFEGEDVIFTETIYNPSILPVFFIDVESYIDNTLKMESCAGTNSALQLIISRFHLMPFTSITRTHKVKCSHRGYYKMTTARVLTKSLIAEDIMYFEFNTELYVYPKLIEYDQLAQPVNFVQGDSIAFRKVMYDPFSITGIRDYAGGDPFNIINFKATAKYSFQGTQSIKVNKMDYCSDRIFMIYINLQTPDKALISYEQYESLIEEALSLAASLISEALKCGYKAGLAANCRLVSGETHVAFPIAGGLYHLEEILKEVAKTKIIYGMGMSFNSLLKRGVSYDVLNAEIFVITPYIDNEIDDCITMLKKNNSVTVIKL